MEAIPEFTYHIETNPKPQEIGTIVIYTEIVGPVDMDLILTRSRFSCSLPTSEFIEDEASPRKKKLYDFLIESGVNEFDAITLMPKFIQIVTIITFSAEYCQHYAMTMLLTLNVVPSSQESVLDDSQFEEVIRVSLDDYERNIQEKTKDWLNC